jgi:hypothetical protein
MLRAIFKSDYFFLVSLPGNIRQLGSFLFGVTPVYAYPPWLSALLPLVISALAVGLLAWRIRKAEASA